jgi:hypothetical protein
MARAFMAAAGLAVLLLSAGTPVALAECMSWPIKATEQPRFGYAFSATVLEASEDVDQPTTYDADYTWHVELAIDRTYRGQMPKRLAFNGWDVGCHSLRGDHLRTGDRIFVATSAFKPNAHLMDPFSVMNGDLIAWKRVAGRWAFYEEALDYGSDKDFYPRAARNATTTADILRIISAAGLPDTSTAMTSSVDGERHDAPVLALVFAAGFLIALEKFRRRIRDGAQTEGL